MKNRIIKWFVLSEQYIGEILDVHAQRNILERDSNHKGNEPQEKLTGYIFR